MLPQKINKFQSRKCHFLRFPQGTCLGNKYEGKCCEGGREESVYGIKQRDLPILLSLRVALCIWQCIHDLQFTF